VFSLNVPLPPAVSRLAGALRPGLTGFDRVRERHTLVCKRFGVDDVRDKSGGAPPARADALDRLRTDLRRPLAGTAPFEVAVTGVDAFESPSAGSAPVVYLAVESDGLVRLHRRLCAAFGAVEGIEGGDYIPHVTLARGWSAGQVESDSEGEDGADGERVDGVDKRGAGVDGALDRLRGVAVEPVRWRVHALDWYDPTAREVAATVELSGASD